MYRKLWVGTTHLRLRGASVSLGACVVFLIFSLQATMASAQQPAAGARATTTAQATDATPGQREGRWDDRYRLGPGDVLDVRIFNRPQLSRDAVRVDGRGMIRLPMVEGEIRAACLTEAELGKKIAESYLRYLNNPQVDVFVKEYQSQPVAVIGAVNAPGRFQMQRRVRLLELLAFAGGPAERAGRNVQVVHAAASPACDPPDSPAPSEDAAVALASYKLSDTLRGDERSNPYVQPGDVVTIPEAEQVYVVGNVFKPSALPLKEPITVSQAIAMAGGVLPDTKSDRVRIVRQTAGGATKTELFVDLKAIEKRRADDVALQPNDIVDVPTSSGKRLLRSLVGAIVPAASQLPVRVIP